MCGRFVLFGNDDDMQDLFELDQLLGRTIASYNIAPTQPIRVIMEHYADRLVRVMTDATWGLVPSWAKPGFRPMINARAETVTEKPSFRGPVRHHRCLVPANGYYEWQGKQPWFLSADEGDPLMAFAGICDSWTCAILTRSAPDALGTIHDRTPLIVPKELWGAWLDPHLDRPDEVRSLIDAVPEPHLLPRRVGREVGSVKNNDPSLISPLERA